MLAYLSVMGPESKLNCWGHRGGGATLQRLDSFPELDAFPLQSDSVYIVLRLGLSNQFYTQIPDLSLFFWPWPKQHLSCITSDKSGVNKALYLFLTLLFFAIVLKTFIKQFKANSVSGIAEIYSRSLKCLQFFLVMTSFRLNHFHNSNTGNWAMVTNFQRENTTGSIFFWCICQNKINQG